MSETSISEHVELLPRSGDPIQDLESLIKLHEGRTRSLRRQLDSLPTKEALGRAIENEMQFVADLKQRKLETIQSQEAERLRLLERKRRTMPHGDLIGDIVKDDDDKTLMYTCVRHPGRKIAHYLWEVHISSFQLHPEIKENNPTFRRMQLEKLERERNDRELEAKRKVQHDELLKHDVLRRQGYVPV